MNAEAKMSDPRAERIAWRRAYGLLGALLVDGLDETRLEAVRALPPLAECLPEEVDLDALAAEHYALFGREVFPYAGVFLEGEGLVGGGAAAETLRQAHIALGIDCPDEPSPDQLGQALRLMAVLVDAELDALAHDDVQDVATLRRWQMKVLDEALLPWMPPLMAAIAGQPPSLWTRVIEMAVGVLARHRAGDSGLPLTVGGEPEVPFDLDALLDDPKTGLRTLAGVLVTPNRSGVYLARRDLEAVARACDLPRGFGGRKDMLEKLLRSAAEYDGLPRLVEELGRLLAARDDVYASLAAEPGLAAQVSAWRRRLAATQGLLRRMGEAAGGVGDGADD